jgi:predicted PurR-regulated permease PerM
MKSSLVQFFSSNQVIALLSSVSIFIVTIFLVAKRWIGFSITFILLLFALIAGILINNPQFITEYSQPHSSISLEQQEDFKKQMLQAIDDVKQEVNTVKENFQLLKGQMQDILSQVDTQKQRLDHFIEETRNQFQSEKSVPEEAKSLP